MPRATPRPSPRSPPTWPWSRPAPRPRPRCSTATRTCPPGRSTTCWRAAPRATAARPRRRARCVLGGGQRGLAGALWLAGRGAAVTVVAEGRPGADTSGLAARALLVRLERAGAALVRGRPARLERGGVVVRGEDGERTVPADALVIAEPLAPAVPPGLDGGAAVRVGDARRPARHRERDRRGARGRRGVRRRGRPPALARDRRLLPNGRLVERMSAVDRRDGDGGTMGYYCGVDIGGTFTDCVIMDESGTLTLAKASSTPPDFSEGFMAAVEEGGPPGGPRRRGAALPDRPAAARHHGRHQRAGADARRPHGPDHHPRPRRRPADDALVRALGRPADRAAAARLAPPQARPDRAAGR